MKLRDVPLENKVFLRLISRVGSDLDEAFRLMRNNVVQEHFAADQGKDEYVQKCIVDARTALASIGRFVETVRVDEERNGRIGMANRFEWVLRHQSKLQTRQLELATCHDSLLRAIGAMHVWEVNPLPPSYGRATRQTLEDENRDESDDACVGPHTRRKRRLLQNEGDPIDSDGSHLDNVHTISPEVTSSEHRVSNSFSPDLKANAGSMPTLPDTKVFQAEVEMPPVYVGYPPGTESPDEKPKLPVPFPFNMATDMKPKIGYGISTENSELERPEHVERSSTTSVWGPSHAARPGWEVFTPELNPKTAGKPGDTDSVDHPAELEALAKDSTASLKRLAPIPVVEVQASNIFGAPVELPHTEPPARPRLVQGLSDPGPASYVSLGLFQPPSDSSARSVPPLEVTSMRKPEADLVVKTNTAPAGLLPRSMRELGARNGLNSNHTFDAASEHAVKSRLPQRSSAMASAPRGILRRRVWSPPSPAVLMSSRPVGSDLTSLSHRFTLSQDSFKEVRAPSPEPDLEFGDSLKEAISGPTLVAATRLSRKSGAVMEDTMKEAYPPPVPPKILERSVSESMKEVVTCAQPPLLPQVPAPPSIERFDLSLGTEKHSVQNSKALGKKNISATDARTPTDMHNTGAAQDLNKANVVSQLGEQVQRKEAIRRRRAARDLFLGDDG